MKEYMKRIIATVLAFVLVMSGLYMTAPEAKEVQAASESTQSSVVNEDMLSIKMQASEPDAQGRVNLRIVSSVDSLDYKNAGFEVWYGNAAENPTQQNMTTKFTTGTAHERIRAGVAYNYSPKVIDPSSEWFVTGVIKNIHSSNLGKDFYIRAFCTTFDGEVVYGVGRYFNVNDASSKSVINIPIAMREAPVTDGNGQLTATVKVGTQSTTATLENYLDGYAQLNVSVTDKTALKSATKISIGGVSTIYRNLESSYNGTADTSWYDVYAAENPNEMEFVIATDADLYGFAALSANNNFAGKTVYAVADIEANKGTQNPWKPIASVSKPFAGHFDGQGHTISGLYQTEPINTYYYGLFESTETGSIIENLRLTDSQFLREGTGNGRIGSIVAYALGGTVRDVYCDVEMINGGQGTGGIIGITGGTVTISNCWFDGTIQATTTANNRAAGIVGWLDGQGTVMIEHCLNSGTISSAATNQLAQFGGLVGFVYERQINLVVRDSLNTGKITTEGATSGVSTIIGTQKSKGTVVVANTYATIESVNIEALKTATAYYLVQNIESTTTTEQVAMLATDSSDYATIKGTDAYKNTLLNFEAYWSAVEGDTPILTSFVTDEKVMDITGVERKVDDKPMTSWYNYYGATGTAENPYVIESAADLYGLASLVGGNNSFAGKHIVMGNDIIVNSSDRDTWETTAPLNNWMSIGSYTSRPFAGHFDGQGHTISGLYTRRLESENYTNYVSLFAYTTGDCVIENLSLKNTTFIYEGTDDFGRMGSFVTDAGGNTILRNLYSDAKLKSAYGIVGGIIGLAFNGTTTKISNCWFDGSIECTKDSQQLHLGGLVGWIAGNQVTIEHCLNSGSVHGNVTYSGRHRQVAIGGLIGDIDAGLSVEVKDCLNTGKVTTAGEWYGVATLIGETLSTSLILHESFATNESCGIDTLAGYNDNNPLYQASSKPQYVGYQDGNINRKAEAELKGVDGYKNTLLDFDDYWTAVDGGTPILTTFVTDEKVVSVKGIDRSVGNDLAWAYTATGTASDPYILEDSADLYRFVALANSGSTSKYENTYFALGDDIVWNASDRGTWNIQAPLNSWTPIGSSSVQFAGKFDGQGYSISGIYQTSPKSGYFGLFSHTTTGCVIENLSLTNSAFTHTGTGDSGRMGSIAAWSTAGTFRNLYSDAKMTNGALVTGGIVGVTVGSTDVSNCWYDGDIYSTADANNLRAAGIVGWVAGGPVNVKHCLNSGNIKTNASAGKGPQQGGLVGYVETSTLVVEDCLNTGLVTTAGATGQVSTLIGRDASAATTTIKDSYAIIESCGVEWLKTQPTNYLYQSDGNITIENVAMLTKDEAEGFLPINGFSGYLNTNLMFDDSETDAKFDGYWVAIEDKAPMLKTFAAMDTMDLTAMNPDTTWYTGDKSEYMIRTAEELYGVATLSARENFANVTIKLGNDITCNRGGADEWSDSNAPDYNWTPIGTAALFFAGGFDGQGYTISGIYNDVSKNGALKHGGIFAYVKDSTIENFSIKNSFYTSGSFNQDNARIGSVAGWVQGGTFSNIYSNANIDTDATNTGGLISLTTGNAVTITNCWFAGEITTASTHYRTACAGILGWANSSVSMKACLNTGKIDATNANYTDANSGHEIGGLIGRVDNGSVTMDNCLHAGSIVEPVQYASKNVAAIIGHVHSVKTAEVSNTYATAEENPTVPFSQDGIIHQENIGIISKDSLKGELAKENTTLDFNNYWLTRQDSTPILQASFSWVWLSELEVPADMMDYSKKSQAITETNGRMLSVFHKGDTVYYPENSIEAVVSAIQMGADVVEVDLCLTKDKKVVLMHDANDLSQTTDWSVKNGQNNLPTSKAVKDWELAELRQLRLKKDGQVTDYVIPTFEEVLRVANARTKLVLDKEEFWDWDDNVYPLIKVEEAWDTCILPREYNLVTKGEIVQQLKQDSKQDDLYVWAFVNFDGSASDDWDTMRDAGMIPIAYWTKECVTPEILDAATQLSTIKGNIRIYGQNHASVSGSSETAERWNLLYENGVNMVLTDRGIDLQKYIAAKFYQ